MLKKGIIWPLVVAHALIDFTSFIGRDTVPAVWNAIAGVVLTFLFMSYGLFFMRQQRDEPMLRADEQVARALN